MLTIENYKILQNKTFTTKSNTQEWIVARMDETEKEYQIVVMPKDGIAYSIGKAIVYQLERISDSFNSYQMFNSKNDRKACVLKCNLTFDNFLLELAIQTALNTN